MRSGTFEKSDDTLNKAAKPPIISAKIFNSKSISPSLHWSGKQKKNFFNLIYHSNVFHTDLHYRF